MQQLNIKKIFHLPVITVLCLFLLSSCGGGSGSAGTTIPADQRAYNAAVATFNAGNYGGCK
jgi:hypothetical protein